jgi:hypothetical protein
VKGSACKRLDPCDAGLGGAIANSTRKRSEAAIKGFDTILNTLKKPPASIEVISQTRWVDQLN